VSGKFQKAKLAQSAAETPAPRRAAVVQIDPGDPKTPVAPSPLRPVEVETKPVEEALTPAVAAAVAPPAPIAQPVDEPVDPVTAATPSADPDDPRGVAIDYSERTVQVGSRMYPGRHRQLKYEAFKKGIDPWEIIDVALDEYLKKRYGRRKP
jgi:hypothetical protein